MKSKLWRCVDEEFFHELNLTLVKNKTSFQQEVTKFLKEYVKNNGGELNGEEKEK